MSARTRSGASARVIVVGILLLLPAADAGAQHSAAHESGEKAVAADAEMSAFLAAARAGAERYKDRQAAIAAGYKQLGMDFPSMGEHWVQPGKVLAGKFDPADPPMLTYATIRGRIELVGVVYAVPLSPGDEPPRLPGGVDRWHEHNGTVDEESMLPEHHSHGGSASGGGSGMRLAILHLWCWVPNPDGVFAADNWALPYVRLGMTPPSTISVPAARALALISGGDRFYSSLLRDASPDGRVTATQDAALREAVVAVNAIVSGRGGAELDESDVRALDRVWTDLAAKAGLLSLGRQK